MAFSLLRRRAGFVFFSFLIIGLLFAAGFAQEQPTGNEDPVAIFNEGQDAHEKGDLAAAIGLYQKALKLQPDFPEAEYQLGNAYFALGKISDSEKAYRRAIELRTDWSLPMTGLGSILLEKNQFPEAELLLLKAIELDDQNAPAYVVLADLRLRTKAAPEVLKDLLTKLTAMTSKVRASAAIWSARAAVERALGDLPAAKNSLGRAAALEPNNKSVIAERTELALAENDAGGALENARMLLKISPDSAHARYLLARAHAAGGNLEEALKIIDSTQNFSPEMKAFRDNIAANSSVNAVDLEKQIVEEPKNALILGRLCTLLRTENPARALNYCRRANEVDPRNISHAVGYGAALVQAKQYENAVALLRRLIGFAPDNYTAHANLAVALFQLKRYPEAKIEYLWLAEKQPDLPVTYYFLGIIYDTLTEYMDAMANYQQFLRLADREKNKLEIDKVNLRLPGLQKQIKDKKGKKNE